MGLRDAKRPDTVKSAPSTRVNMGPGPGLVALGSPSYPPSLKQLGIGCVHNTIGGRGRLPIQHDRLPRTAAN